MSDEQAAHPGPPAHLPPPNATRGRTTRSHAALLDRVSAPTRDSGIRLIAAYKFIKGGLGLALSLTLFILLGVGAAPSLQVLAAGVPHHFAGAWSIQVSKLLFSVTQPHHLLIVALALGLDGLFTVVEGWALRHGHWWGPWLVIVTTSSLLPFEVFALMHHVHAARVVVLTVNLAIVAYLVWRRLALRVRMR